MKSGQKPINLDRVLVLYVRGLTYREIGIQVAKDEGRRVPYASSSISRVIYQHFKGHL